MRSGESVVRVLNRTSALVSDGAGKRGVLDSSVPLEGQTPGGQSALLDLRLARDGSSWVPNSALGGLRLPDNATGEASFSSLGISVHVAGAAHASAQIVQGKAFYPNVAKDTDLVLRPTPTGVEVSLVLRSPASPTDISLVFSLPAGDTVRNSGPLDASPTPVGTTEVMQGAKRALSITPSTAVDAQGKEVPVTSTIGGSDRLVLHVGATHDVAWPVLVDPTMGVYDPYGQNTPALFSSQWQFYSNNAGYSADTHSNALFVYDNGGHTYNYADYGEWVRYARPGAFIYRVDETNASSGPYYDLLYYHGPTTQAYEGIYDFINYKWAAGSWSDTNGSSGSPAIRGLTGKFYSDVGTICVPGCSHLSSVPQGSPTASPNAAVFGTNFLYNNYALPSGAQGWVALGDAATLSSDNQVPSLSVSHSNPPPSGWVNSYNDTVSMHSQLPGGLGMGTQAVSGTGLVASTNSAGQASLAVSANCNGQYSSCPLNQDASVTYGLGANTPDGTLPITGAATDLVGNHDPHQDQAWQINVDRKPPTGQLNPLAGNGGGVISVSGQGSDPPASGANGSSGFAGAVVQVQKSDGTVQYPCGTTPIAPTDSNGDFTCNWDTADGGFPNGSYAVTVTLSDNAKNTYVPPSQTIAINNITLGNQNMMESPGGEVSQVDVNPTNGNALVSAEDPLIANTDSMQAFSRAYNSNGSATRDLGIGWLHNAGNDVRLRGNQDGSLTFFDETGSVERFVSDGTGAYQSTDGDYGTITSQNGNYVLAENSSTTYTFNLDGQLTQMQDAMGNILNYSYTTVNGQPRLASIKDPGGTMTNFKYDGSGNATEVDTPDGTTYQYGYDGQDHLVSYAIPSQNLTTTYRYNAVGLLAEIDDANGNVAKLGYDAQNRTSSVEVTTPASSDAGATDQTTTYAYGSPNGPCDSANGDVGRTTATNPDGTTQDYCYDASGNVTSTSPDVSGGKVDPGTTWGTTDFGDPGSGSCTRTDYCGQNDLPEPTDTSSSSSTSSPQPMAMTASASSGHPAKSSPFWGLADNNPPTKFDAWGSPSFPGLGVHNARRTVAWDIANYPTDSPYVMSVETWIANAQRAGQTIYIGFEHCSDYSTVDGSTGVGCATRAPAPSSGSRNGEPMVADYGAAITKFMDLHPNITHYESWNEPNAVSQPTADAVNSQNPNGDNPGGPAMAAEYYVKAASVCASRSPKCSVAAGSFSDGSLSPRVHYVQSYMRQLGRMHVERWAWHAYTDTQALKRHPHHRTWRYLRAFIRTITMHDKTHLWITEIGAGDHRYFKHINSDMTQARLTRRIVTDLYSVGGAVINRVFYYSLRGDKNFNTGLLNDNDSQRPAYSRYANR